MDNLGKSGAVKASLAPSDLVNRVGEELGVSSWITIDQDRINEFAHCTGDNQWIHVDVERARRERPTIGTIAHGYLTLSLLASTTFEILGATVQLKEGVNYGLNKVRFLSVVRSGSRVRNHLKIAAVDDKGGGHFLLTAENTMEIENESKPALVATTLAILS